MGTKILRGQHKFHLMYPNHLFCRGAVFRLTGLSDLSAGLFRRGIPSGEEDLDLLDLERDLEDLKNRTKFRSLSFRWQDLFGVGGYRKNRLKKRCE